MIHKNLILNKMLIWQSPKFPWLGRYVPHGSKESPGQEWARTACSSTGPLAQPGLPSSLLSLSTFSLYLLGSPSKQTICSVSAFGGSQTKTKEGSNLTSAVTGKASIHLTQMFPPRKVIFFLSQPLVIRSPQNQHSLQRKSVEAWPSPEIPLTFPQAFFPTLCSSLSFSSPSFPPLSASQYFKIKWNHDLYRKWWNLDWFTLKHSLKTDVVSNDTKE